MSHFPGICRFFIPYSILNLLSNIGPVFHIERQVSAQAQSTPETAASEVVDKTWDAETDRPSKKKKRKEPMKGGVISLTGFPCILSPDSGHPPLIDILRDTLQMNTYRSPTRHYLVHSFSFQRISTTWLVDGCFAALWMTGMKLIYHYCLVSSVYK